MAVSAAGLSLLQPEFSYWLLIPCLLLLGFGFVLGNSPRLILLHTSVPRSLASTVQSVGDSTAHLGGALALSFMLTLLENFGMRAFRQAVVIGGLTEQQLSVRITTLVLASEDFSSLAASQEHAALLKVVDVWLVNSYVTGLSQAMLVLAAVCLMSGLAIYFGMRGMARTRMPEPYAAGEGAETILTQQPLDFIPTWGWFLLTPIVLLLAAEAGLHAGRSVQRRWPDRSETAVGGMVGAALTLLGLLLAFLSNYSVGIFHERRLLVIQEANAAGTAYLRAGYLPEPYRTESRLLLKEYVDLRLRMLHPVDGPAALERSLQIQDQLWGSAESVAVEYPLPTISLYLAAVNEVIDLSTARLSAEVAFRVPSVMLLGLIGVALVAMSLVGVQDSYSERRNLLALGAAGVDLHAGLPVDHRA